METDNLDIVDQTSRTGMLLHNSIHYKRRRDLETNGNIFHLGTAKLPSKTTPTYPGSLQTISKIGQGRNRINYQSEGKMGQDLKQMGAGNPGRT